MWHFLRVNNIGDAVGPDLVSHLAGRPTLYSSDATRPRLFAIGSILGSVDANALVWGSGLMDPDQSPSQLAASNVFALRGKPTYARLREVGINVPDVPLGDPGILVPALFDTSGPKRYRLGVIAHYADRQHPTVQRLRNKEGVLDIDVRQRPEVFFRALGSCEAIVSSSLHGLIFAEALGIPNLWIKLSDRVVRTGFKFRDWFSLTAKPQLAPYEPAPADSARELIERATTHDCTIDRRALAGSFPTSRLEELSESLDRTFVSLSLSRRRPLPIFVISYNRAAFLRRSIASYRRMEKPVEIIVHDNGSDDPETLRALEDIQRAGGIVYNNPPIRHPDELNGVNHSISDYFKNWSEPSRYVVTDCDIDLSIADTSALDVYDELLDRYTAVQCVGPMLRIRDIPRNYPLFRRVTASHIDQFWHRRPEWVDLSQGRVATIEAPIDTTFALHRAGEPFHRLESARRVYYPFEAQHLDWYVGPQKHRRSVYFSTSSSEISHWNNREGRELAERERPKLGAIIYTDRNGAGELVEKTFYPDRPRPFWRRLTERG